jgi:choline dehydrogenase-like flavoprotein
LPNPNNRIEIVPEKNAAGMFQMKVFCAFGSRDMMSIDKTARMLSDYLLKSKLGIATVDNDSIFFNTWGWAHPSGITRFGSSPKESVCDSNGRVWAYQNLFINGSSVFPTVGYANPAWTIVALGLRLGDYLLRESKKS